ncbi:hypothetical protein ES332_A12G160500v1 [Gossypium tomentosum]|uniref:Uncharacterized protein n=1 Tax=Gossypium tomentosum TaxID=34277 RepID=A0A5D2MY21_GOSTO|nr:hypothetical protein ES332_A12G160500v1 [Gossypium tomentosum]
MNIKIGQEDKLIEKTSASNATQKVISTKNKLHQPGIEPRSVPWQSTILPLDHWCKLLVYH